MRRYLGESDIEEAAIEWLKDIYPYHYQHGEEIHRPLNKAVLENVFESFLQRKYKHVPAKILSEVKQEFLFNSGSDIHHRNHEFHKKLSKGISKTWTLPSPDPSLEGKPSPDPSREGNNSPLTGGAAASYTKSKQAGGCTTV